MLLSTPCVVSIRGCKLPFLVQFFFFLLAYLCSYVSSTLSQQIHTFSTVFEIDPPENMHGSWKNSQRSGCVADLHKELCALNSSYLFIVIETLVFFMYQEFDVSFELLMHLLEFFQCFCCISVISLFQIYHYDISQFRSLDE